MSIIFLCSPPLYLFDVGDNSVYIPVSKLTNIARFDQDVDRDSNFKHSTVLAMPIKHAGSPGRVLGVFQLVNKFDNLPFTRWLNKFRRGREKAFLELLEGLSRCGQQIWHSQDFISPTPICLILGWLVWLAVTKHKVSAIRSERLYQSYQFAMFWWIFSMFFSVSAMTSILWTRLPYSVGWVSPMWWTSKPSLKPMLS